MSRLVTYNVNHKPYETHMNTKSVLVEILFCEIVICPTFKTAHLSNAYKPVMHVCVGQACLTCLVHCNNNIKV